MTRTPPVTDELKAELLLAAARTALAAGHDNLSRRTS
jgi:hypothetical protein